MYYCLINKPATGIELIEKLRYTATHEKRTPMWDETIEMHEAMADRIRVILHDLVKAGIIIANAEV